MTLSELIELCTDLLLCATIVFCAVGLFELLRPNPKVRP